MTILFVYVPIHSKVSLIAEDYISMKISLNYRVRHLTFSSTWAYFAHVWFNRELVLSFCRTNKVVYKLKHRLAKRACDRLTEDADFGKKNHLFWWGSFWSWRVCKQAKLSNLGHPKRVCLVRILFQKHNWSIFLRKWARGGRNSQWRSLSFHVESIFVHKNWRGWYWQHLISTGRRYNNQNCGIWGTEKPHACIENPTHPKRVTVWCGFWSRDKIRPFFFENAQGEAATFTDDRYRAMLN